MHMLHKKCIPILLLLVVTLSCNSKKSTVRNDFKKYYDQFGVEGSFVLYNQNVDNYTFYNREQFDRPFSPASTFKICNSLIGLETGVINDENFVIPWDSIKRNEIWDKDHDLKTAFANSTVWYYQELARRVGGAQMKYWLDQCHYGNADTSGGIDQFWLTGGLRITPHQQIDFLRELYHNKLPFSQRSMDIVKKIMVVKDTSTYIIRAKTGWGMEGDKDVGWYVGYIETPDNVYYFANCVQMDSKYFTDNTRSVNFDRCRRDIVYLILDELGIVKK